MSDIDEMPSEDDSMADLDAIDHGYRPRQPDCEIFNNVVHWQSHVIFVADGRWAHLARGEDLTWCGSAALDVAMVDDYPPCQPCLTAALAQSPLDSCLWRWYKATRGDANAAPSARWCSTCGSAQRAGRCPRCD